MNIDDPAYKYANTQGGGIIPPCTGLTPDALPEVQKPVSAENSHTHTHRGVPQKCAVGKQDYSNQKG